MINPVVLYPGDKIHLFIPNSGSSKNDNELIEQLRTIYARFGVSLVIGTATDMPGAVGVIAIFREEK